MKAFYLALFLLFGTVIGHAQNCLGSKAFDTNYTPAVAGNNMIAKAPLISRVKVCNLDVLTTQTDSAVIHVGLVYGTGTNCSVGTTMLTPMYPISTATIRGYAKNFGSDAGPVAPPGTSICLQVDSVPAYMGVMITYAIF